MLKMFKKPPNSTMFNLSECKVLIIFLTFDSRLTEILRNIFKFVSIFWKTSEFNSVLKFFNRDKGGIGRKEKYGEGFVGFLVETNNIEFELRFVKGGYFRQLSQFVIRGSKNLIMIDELQS